MDKRDDRVRRYIAQRCDLLGAIRLPNNAFLANAGTEINTDILFFQKRETPRDLNVDLPDWVEVEKIYENDHVNEQGESRHRVVSINPYFSAAPGNGTGRAGDRVRPVWATACMQALSRQGFKGTSGAGSGEP